MNKKVGTEHALSEKIILIQLQKKDLTTLIFVNLKFISTFASRDVGLPRPKKIINKSNNNLIFEHPLRKRAGVRIKKLPMK